MVGIKLTNVCDIQKDLAIEISLTVSREADRINRKIQLHPSSRAEITGYAIHSLALADQLAGNVFFFLNMHRHRCVHRVGMKPAQKIWPGRVAEIHSRNWSSARMSLNFEKKWNARSDRMWPSTSVSQTEVWKSVRSQNKIRRVKYSRGRYIVSALNVRTYDVVQHPWMFPSHETYWVVVNCHISVLDTKLDLLDRNVEIYVTRQLLLFVIGKLHMCTILYCYLFLLGFQTQFFLWIECEKIMDHK